MEISRDDFVQNADGSWSPNKQVVIEGPNGTITIGPGMSFRKGVQFMGVDIAEVLEG